MKKIKQIGILGVFVCCGFLVAQLASAQEQCQIVARKGTTVDLNRTAECMENRYGFDENFMRRSKKKELAPNSELHFDITAPMEGEKVTAMAVAKGFKNAAEDLYYTWYLLRTDPETGNPLPGETIANAKRRAMGIVARGDYDPELFGETYTVDNDDDGFYASYGGQDGVGAKEGDSLYVYDDSSAALFDVDKQIVRTAAITRCYRHNFGIKVYDTGDGDSGSDNRAGRDQIIPCIHEFPSCGGFTLGNGSFGLAEEECWRTDPTNHDTDGDGIEDEADLAGLNQQQFTWKYREGDHVGVVVEGTSLVPISEGGNDVSYTFTYVRSNRGTFATYEEAYADCATLLPDEVDVSNMDNSSTAAYDACVESIEEVWGPGVITDSDGALNAYYKIMWATPDICARSDDSRTYISGDHCGRGESDVGFNYLAALPVNPEGGKILEPELSFIPENPQFDAVAAIPEEERTDLITVSATTASGNVDEDFLFYDWTVGKCDASLTNCSFPSNVQFETFDQGMGVKEIQFKPTAASFAPGEDKIFLQATLVQSEHPTLIGDTDPDARGFDVGAIETIVIPVARKDIALRFYEAQRVGATWVQGPEICGGGGNPLYLDVCPVYSYQVIAVEADVLGGINAGDRFAWQLNGESINPPFDTTVYAGAANSDSSVIFLPMQGYDESLQDISVSYKKNQGGTLTDILAGRKISVNNPIAAVEATAGAVPTTRWDGADSLDIFEADPGTVVSFRARIIPDYMTINAGATLIEALEQDPLNPADDIILGDDEVHLMWYLNGEFVGPQYIADHPELAIGVAGDTITFTLDADGTFGGGYDLMARVEKRFDPAHVQMLDDAWKILDTHTITNDTSKTIRLSYNAAMAGGGLPPNPTLGQYLASSFANAPHYLIFCVRLGVAMSLVWFVLFGFSYAIRLNKEL